MSSKNNQGFGLVEVMVALAIAALIITPVFVTMSTVLRTVTQRSNRYSRYSDAQNQLIEMVSYLRNGVERSPEPITGIMITADGALPTSLSSIGGLHMARAELVVRNGRQDRKEALVYIYHLPAKESKS